MRTAGLNNIQKVIGWITLIITGSGLIVSSVQAAQDVRYVRPEDVEESNCTGQPCMTLQQYLEQTVQYFTSDSTFFFMEGEHHLGNNLTLTLINSLTFQGERYENGSIATRLLCSASTQMRFESVSNVHLDTIALVSCVHMFHNSDQVCLTNLGFIAHTKSAVTAISSQLNLTNCVFTSGSATQGSALYLNSSSINFSGANNFLYNTALMDGGTIYMTDSHIIFYGSAKFTNNKAQRGGAIFSTTKGNITFIGSSLFTSNSATTSEMTSPSALLAGAAVYLSSSSLLFKGDNSFELNVIKNLNNTTSDTNNLVNLKEGGGAIAAFDGSQIVIDNHTGFIYNEAPKGGALCIENSTLQISGSTLFLGNEATKSNGGAIHLGKNSNLVCIGTTKFLGNSAKQDGGAVEIENAQSAYIDEALVLTNNALGGSGGGISLKSAGNVTMINCNYTANTATDIGGGIYMSLSMLVIRGSSILDSNFAGSGGAVAVYAGTLQVSGVAVIEDHMALRNGSGGIYASSSSSVFLSGNVTFYNNSGFRGGAMLIKSSRLEVSDGDFMFSSNAALYLGGAIYTSVNSALSFGGNVTFNGNTAREGGALVLEDEATLFLNSPLKLNFYRNKAVVYGGGIYYTESLSLNECLKSEHHTVSGKCFIEVTGCVENISLNFVNNDAGLAGSNLYGGGLEKCSTNIQNITGGCDVYQSEVQDSLGLFLNISTTVSSKESNTSTISSQPSHVCFCEDNIPNCSILFLSPQLYPGELLSMSIVTLGQGDGAVPASISVEARDNFYLTPTEQSQHTGKVCTVVKLRVRSNHSEESLSLRPGGTCGEIGVAHKDVHATLLPCPHGFKLISTSFSTTTIYSECVCEDVLRQRNVTCHIDTIDFEVKEKLWIQEWLDMNGTYGGVMLSSACLSTYCIPPPFNVTLHDPDVQCNFNRSGVLCGRCREGYSVVFGGPNCFKCSNRYLGLLVVFAVIGVMLVVFLFIFRLTLTAGTIHSLILYANIVQINKDVLLAPNQRNLLTVFVAWLNLDFGIETCFYSGMDAYAQTWLQFVFPIYLCFLLVVISIMCCCSHKLRNIFSSSILNVLATILLLSYSKLLKTSVDILSASKVNTPKGEDIVWIKDGNERYFRETQHILLGAVALLVLVFLIIPFALLILLWNLSMRTCNKKTSCFSRLAPIMEAFSVPFKTGSFWVGLLLVTRLFLYLGTAFVPSNTTLLITVIIISLLIVIFSFLKKEQCTNFYFLELSFFINIMLLSSLTFYSQSTGNNIQGSVADVSLGIAFVEFLGILVYHSYLQFFKGSRVGTKLIRCISRRKDGNDEKESVKIKSNKIEDACANEDQTNFISGFVVLKQPLLES